MELGKFTQYPKSCITSEVGKMLFGIDVPREQAGVTIVLF